jgi:hypothetical protein
MNPHPRRRSRWKWIGLMGCIVLLVIWMISFRSSVGYCRYGIGIGIRGGAFAVCWGPGVKEDPATYEWLISNIPLVLVSWKPELAEFGYVQVVIVPCWIFLLCVAVPTAIRFLRDRRPPIGHCQACGYDLTGNESGTCPECGVKA